jgi:hypothetical protein
MSPLRTHAPVIEELWALLSSYRRGIRTATEARLRSVAETPSDERLLELLSEPFDSVDDAAERLANAAAHLRDRNDRRSVFLTVYSTMTEAVRAGIDSATFEDSEWVRAYLVTFAEHYRRALLAFERREFGAVPRPWRIAFAASLRGETLVTQDALLGINAHINYDLTYALDEVAIDPNREAKRADHDRINDVLERLTDVVQETLASVYGAEGISELDAALGEFDERLSLSGLAGSRHFAWRNAVLLADWPSWLAPRYVDWRTRTVATGVASAILTPSIDATVAERLRDLESEGTTLASFDTAFRRRARASVGVL